MGPGAARGAAALARGDGAPMGDATRVPSEPSEKSPRPMRANEAEALFTPASNAPPGAPGAALGAAPGGVAYPGWPKPTGVLRALSDGRRTGAGAFRGSPNPSGANAGLAATGLAALGLVGLVAAPGGERTSRRAAPDAERVCASRLALSLIHI